MDFRFGNVHDLFVGCKNIELIVRNVLMRKFIGVSPDNSKYQRRWHKQTGIAW